VSIHAGQIQIMETLERGVFEKLEKEIKKKTHPDERAILDVNEAEDYVIVGVSLNMFKASSPFRLMVYNLIKDKRFEIIILFFIVLSCITLAMSSPLNDPNGTIQATIFKIDVFTTVVFILEYILKIITFGFVSNGRTSYLRDIWNLVDFFVVIMSVLSLSPVANVVKSLKMFRVMRVLRLFRLAEGLRIGLQALLQAIPSVLKIVMIMLINFLIFAIITISQFKGRFFYCTANLGLSMVESHSLDYKWDCLNAGEEWVNSYYNFDNIY